MENNTGGSWLASTSSVIASTIIVGAFLLGYHLGQKRGYSSGQLDYQIKRLSTIKSCLDDMDKEQFIRMFNEDMLLGTPVFEAYTMGKLGECADQRIKEETSK